MDDVVLDFLADLYIAEHVAEKTGETFLQFVARKERDWRKGVRNYAAPDQPIAGMETVGGAKS